MCYSRPSPPNTASPQYPAHFQVPNKGFVGYILLPICRFPNTAAFSSVPRSAEGPTVIIYPITLPGQLAAIKIMEVTAEEEDDIRLEINVLRKVQPHPIFEPNFSTP